MYSAIRGARNSSSRYARRLSSVLSTPIASKRLLMVLVLSSAARMPLPGATSARATSASSVTASGYLPVARASRGLLRRWHATVRGEELAQDRLALRSPYPEPPPWMVIELWLFEQLRDRDHSARFVVRRAEDDQGHAREHDRAGAHRARLDRHVERAVAQTPAPQCRPRRAKREHFGVGRRI